MRVEYGFIWIRFRVVFTRRQWIPSPENRNPPPQQCRRPHLAVSALAVSLTRHQVVHVREPASSHGAPQNHRLGTSPPFPSQLRWGLESVGFLVVSTSVTLCKVDSGFTWIHFRVRFNRIPPSWNPNPSSHLKTRTDSLLEISCAKFLAA